jgi:hypothetical protein
MSFFAGGYFIVRGYINEGNGYIPQNYYTVSNCIGDIIPNTWAWNKTLSKKECNQIKVDYNIDNNQIQNIRETTLELMKNDKFQLPYIFPSIDIAREFYIKYFSHLEDVKIMGISLNEKYTNEFLVEEGNDDFGVSVNLSLSKSIDSNGKFIGYEVLGYEYWGFHTMYCHRNLINYCITELHINFNGRGLVDTLEDAEKIVNSIREAKVVAEPALWQPWAVYEFSIG